ncbi:agenet domain-containing protein [Azospirillum griseum]|uniref:Peptidase S1 domain-containing protein n=1 Tax=Azospirillum griseum TaxID=2496639 RepID=A0A431VD89_9PROT|nr:agenet domain-containing protein [Azospirillum griseum]RTR17050.1 hypothetical protein EJ903_18960 [Azospirillum griseum]
MVPWLGRLCLLVGLLLPHSAPAVVILDSTWREEGGRPDRENAGFGAHIRLAQEPQFRSVLSISLDGGTSWGDGSGTWIGNDDRHAYILTSAHNFDETEVEEARFRTDDGTVLRADRLWIHPDYDSNDDWSGRDAAIVRLTRPITHLGPQPVLYGGRGEKGHVITFVGYGTRGIGSVGEDEQRFNTGLDKAAAQGFVDEVEPLRRPTDDQDAGNSLAVFLPREDGRIENPLGSDYRSRPASRLVGLLGSGDSGGSAWMQDGGRWVIVGINTAGDGKAGYGDSSWFVRINGIRPWIQKTFPGAAFSDQDTAPAAMVAAAVPAAPAIPNAIASAEPPARVGVRPTGTGADSPAGLCAPRARVFVWSEDAWYTGRARGPARDGRCRVRLEDADEDDDDEMVDAEDLVAWTAQGPGRAVTACQVGLTVVAEDNGVWFPGEIKRAKGNACVVAYDDEDFDDESLPLERIRRLR